MAGRDVIKITGGVAVGVGSLMVLTAGGNLLAQTLLSVPIKQPTLPPPLDLLSDIWRHVGLLAGAQILLGAAVIAAGVGLLHTKTWGRWVLELTTWLALCSYVLLGILWMKRWAMAPAESSGPWREFAVFGAGVLGFWSAVFVLVICFLRSRRFRNSLSGQHGAG